MTDREAFEAWKQQVLPKAGAVVHVIAEQAWNAALATRQKVDVEKCMRAVDNYANSLPESSPNSHILRSRRLGVSKAVIDSLIAQGVRIEY